MNNRDSINSSGLSLYASDVSTRKLQLLDDFIISGKILDVGCGNGLYGLHLASRGCNVFQIDLADRRNESSRHIPFKVMDAQQLNFADHEFDHVIAFDIIEHLDDDINFVKSVHRICNHRLILSVPNGDDEQIENLGVTHIHYKDKTHRREYGMLQVESLLSNNGFDILKLYPNFATGLLRFAFAFAKKNFAAKVAAKLIELQCKALMKVGLFENRTIGDWYCVAEKRHH